ncbi:MULTISPECIES: VOC family protein [unclassified Cellulosimicrobium]|uniref:VOC family protein n=1 Tax=Cellulosimicrobium sp. ES-005 TaxID=3163031 RepID=A0AAU8G5U8_9MICO
MDQSLHFVTVATRDLDAARAFYGALGWTAQLDVPGEIVFYRSAAGQLLGFFEESAFARDAGTPDATPATTGLTLSHNVGSRAAVVELVQAMVDAGGTVRKAPQEGEFGGVFHAHVADPNGLVWEVAHNPAWSVRADGTVDLG